MKPVYNDMVVCPVCGARISSNASRCPNCGEPIEKKKGKLKTFIVIVLAGLIISSIMSAIQDETNSVVDDNKDKVYNSDKTDNVTNSEEKSIKFAEIDISDYMEIDAELLYEHGKNLVGEKIITVIKISQISKNVIKANTDNNDGILFSIICNFDEKEDIKELRKNQKITVAATVVDNIFDNVELENCYIVGMGEIENQLKESGLTAESLQAQISQRKLDMKDDFINSCEYVSYDDVARNPENYTGKAIKITGTVIQVSEGYGNDVTLRVNCDGDTWFDGNTWYVEYRREENESRILQYDDITCYGECKGVESYTSVLGGRVTIPSLEMKYYEQNVE